MEARSEFRRKEGEKEKMDIAIVTNVFLIVLLVFTELRNMYERNNLLNRLMARDYEEFARHEEQVKKLTVPKTFKRDEGIRL